MNEQLRQFGQNRIEIIREANNRLGIVVDAIGKVVDEVIRPEEVPEHARLAAVNYAGAAIKTLVQEHLRTYLVDSTSVRGLGVDMGLLGSAVLEVDSGELYDVEISGRSIIRSVQPLPDKEWFRNRDGILRNVLSLKFY